MQSYLKYMLHDTPDSRYKARYNSCEFVTNCGDKYLSILSKTLILFNNAKYIDIILELYQGSNYDALSVARSVMYSGDYGLYDFWKKNQCFINQTVRDRQHTDRLKCYSLKGDK